MISLIRINVIHLFHYCISSATFSNGYLIGYYLYIFCNAYNTIIPKSLSLPSLFFFLNVYNRPHKHLGSIGFFDNTKQ